MADSPNQVLAAKEAELNRERQEHFAAIQKIEVQLELVKELRKTMPAPRSKRPTKHRRPHVAPAEAGEMNSKLSPSAAIIAYLKRHPDSSKSAVVDGVLGQINTESKKPRDMVRTRIGQMITGGRIIQNDKTGNLRLTEEPKE